MHHAREFPGLLATQDLTNDSRKAALYADDSFFREGWSDICALQDKPVSTFVSPLALVLFKSEAIAAGKVVSALDWLAERRFLPVALDVIPFSGPAIHGLWRYQIRRNTIDKIRLYTRWIGQTPALVVALRSSDSSQKNASQTVSRLKGAAQVAKRSGEDLRTYLQSPNSILNFVHAADEPADVVRELAVLVPAPRRSAFIRSVDQGFLSRDILLERLAEVEPAKPHHANPHLAGRAIIRKLMNLEGLRAASAIAKIERVLAGEVGLDLYDFEEDCVALLDDVDPVDMFVFGSEFIERDIVGMTGDLERHDRSL